MNSPLSSFRCVLIGAETLLIECGELLLRQGHAIGAVVTAAEKVASWAARHGLRCIDARGDYVAALSAESFDYLFSITHLSLIPSAALALPRKAAINFHDGPLPHYAGLNTPVWALLNGETDYAVTWHYLDEGVDTGEVLVQRPVEISADDTALSLNTKCFQAGIESFGELIGTLAAGGLVSRVQDFRTRRCFSKHDRPAAGCLLDWMQPSADLERLVRALDHGRYRNPVGTPKVRMRGVNRFVIAARVSDREEAEAGPYPGPLPTVHGASSALPGTIVAIGAFGVRVACGRGTIDLQTFSLPCGKTQAGEVVAAVARWNVGDRFDLPTADVAARVTELNRMLAKSEAYWVRKLSKIDAPGVPYASSDSKSSAAPQWFEARHDLTAEVVERFAAVGAEEAIVCALAGYLARVGEKASFDLGFVDLKSRAVVAGLEDWVAPCVPLRCDIDPALGLVEHVRRTGGELAAVRKHVGYLRDLPARFPEVALRAELADGRALPIVAVLTADVEAYSPISGPTVQLVASIEQRRIRWIFDETQLSEFGRAVLARQFEQFLVNLSTAPESPLGEIEYLAPAERRQIVHDWNATTVDSRRDVCVHELFAEQAARTPDAVAVVFENRSLTYRELQARVERLAARLRRLGIGPDRFVGIHLERSENLVVAVMATLQAGGAYLPLDPNYPDERIAFMIADAAAPVIVTERETRDRLPQSPAVLLEIDGDAPEGEVAAEATTSGGLASAASPDNLAYVIYTSGSTGKPKGVMVEHRNAVNFFVGMDERIFGRNPDGSIGDRTPGTWLAVTSLSFDIHVLELLWTLTRGFKVVVHRDRELGAAQAVAAGPGAVVTVEAAAESRTRPATRSRPMDFSLFYFSADSEEHGRDKYRLLIDGARWADEHDFVAVWTPERHFHSFGGLYPNPAVTGAAVATITKRVQIRAGSIVLPLHHPARVAEQWQMVDNLSDGRVGIAMAAGWMPNDFVLMPENYADAKNVMFRDTEIVRRLWRGESVEFPGATGKPVAVRTLPRPIQPEVPLWITTAGNPETYRQAGAIGANLLTHLLGQSVEELAPKIAAYRAARAAAGFDPQAGVVSLMLHTFVGDDETRVRETVRGPMKAYLGTSLNLLKQYAWAFPAFKRPQGTVVDSSSDFASLTPEEQDSLLDFAFDRYYETSGLFGTPEAAAAMVEKLKQIDVDEIACLIDFGIPTATVLENLPHLDVVRREADIATVTVRETAPTVDAAVSGADAIGFDTSLAAAFRRHGVTHFQCTPSLARVLLSDEAGREAARSLQLFCVGGEALPVDLARELKACVGGRVLNMYGPTETTVWSTAFELGAVDGPIPIGRPLANQRAYVLDARRRPVPAGVPGELYLGGDGVTRGYLHRPELTAERFVVDPFVAELREGRIEARMYRTGDLVRWRADGVIEFLGRTDHQIKIRGHRIELGEIESRILDDDRIGQCVVVGREPTPGDMRLAAYFAASAAIDESELRSRLRATLPDYMVPQHFIALSTLPLTPNGKVDRKALPAFDTATIVSASEFVAPENDTERRLAELWQELLGRASIGIDENFFEIGGHSLLVVRMHRRLANLTAKPTALTDLFRYPTIRTLAAFLSGAAQVEQAASSGTERARRRLERTVRRRLN